MPLPKERTRPTRLRGAPARAPVRRSTAAAGRATPIEGGPFAPQLCRSQKTPPGGNDWLHETKWDGYRLLATVRRGRVRFWSRNGNEWTERVPELVAAVASLGLRDAQLDGEMIVLRDGRPDFNALQGRLSATEHVPAVYMAFDMPHCDGVSLRNTPLVERKAALREILQRHPHDLLRYSEHVVGHGADVFAQASRAGLEGIVSKRCASRYDGTRNGDWLKIKARASDEFVVVGFTEPKGSRSGIGALLLAEPQRDGLLYIGRVGTGLDNTQLRELRRRLQPMRIDAPPADISRMARKDRALAHWVRPELVIEVFHQGIGSQGLLRQPAFKAIRADKTLRDLQPLRATAPAGTKRARVAHAGAPGAARSERAPARGAAAAGDPDRVRITHPERVVFAQSGCTKGDVVRYYRSVAPWLLKEISGRPLSILRCPDGTAKACFFQKHMKPNMGADVHGIPIRDSSGDAQYLCVGDAAGLLELVQRNVIEFHPWGARSKTPDRADRIVFDLDPHASVAWPRVRTAAKRLHDALADLGLESFLRTSGGKGLHVVVPLKPAVAWDGVKAFAKAFAEAMTAQYPQEFVATAGEKNRQGKIFIDWLRNYRGSTSVASYSLRARPDGGAAMPLAWSQLPKLAGAAQYTVQNAAAYVRRRRSDPWDGIDAVRQSLPRKMRTR